MLLNINPSYTMTDSKTICQSALPYEWNGVTFTAAGVQTANLQTVNGCDSVVVMILTVNDYYAVNETKTICQNELPYEWNGVTFTTAGEQTVLLQSVNGCDSMVTMTLTVSQNYAVTEEVNICASELPYEWNGIIFTEEGSQTVTLQTIHGCDSVVTMTLTVSPTYAITDEATICASALPYEWNGVTFTESGTQTATLQAMNGCDSVVTMTLTVNDVYAVTETLAVCPNELPYEWNGVTFTAAGIQMVTLTAANGCDSVVTMILNININYTVTDTKTICTSELPYEWNGMTFPAAGVQTVTLQTVNG